MEIEQLELDLWRSLSTAIKFPETADFQGLYNALESEIAHQPVREQLQIAAQALVELAQVYAARVELLLSGWERRYNPAEPVVDLENCVELFVQSLHLDVAELFEPDAPVNYPENRSSKKTSVADGSLVSQVDKSVMLNALEAIVTESAQTPDDTDPLNVAHAENISQWSEAISAWMQKKSSSKSVVSLLELQQGLRMPIVEVWLGLLLGGQERYGLEQQGTFYSAPDEIFVFKR